MVDLFFYNFVTVMNSTCLVYDMRSFKGCEKLMYFKYAVSANRIVRLRDFGCENKKIGVECMIA